MATIEKYRTHPQLLTRITTKLRHNPLHISIYLLALFPFLNLLIFVSSNYIPVPWQDEWHLPYRLVSQSYSGETITLNELATPLGGHRLLFPNSLSLLFAHISGWQSWMDVSFSILLVCANFVLISFILNSQIKNVWSAFTVMASAWLLFSLIQHDNWIWAYQKSLLLPSCMVAIAAWSLNQWPRTWLALALCAVASFVASWSFASGNALWILIPIAMWLNGYRSIKCYVLWCVCAITSIGLYANGLPVASSAEESGLSFLIQDLFAIRFIIHFLGSPFSSEMRFIGIGGIKDITNSGIFGVLGSGLFATNLIYNVVWVRTDRQSLSPWFLLTSYTLACGAFLLAGRANSLQSTLVSRYTTFVIPFWIVLVTMIAINIHHIVCQDKRIFPALLVIANILGVGMLVFGYVGATYSVYSLPNRQDQIAECMLAYPYGNPQCVETRLLTQHRDQIEDSLRFMRENRLSLFGDWTRLPQLDEIYINHIESQDTRYMPYNIDGHENTVLFQRAPSMVEQAIYVPDKALSFATDAHVVVRNQQATNAGDSLLFQVWIITEEDTQEKVYESNWSPSDTIRDTFVLVDLDPYAYKVIRIKYVIEASVENISNYWNMWIEPRIMRTP